MDPVRNPFAPGAGTPPPAFAGRAELLEKARIALLRVRDQLVQARTGLVVQARGLAKALGTRLPPCDPDQFATRMATPERQALFPGLAEVCTVVALLTAQIKQLDRAIAALRDSLTAREDLLAYRDAEINAILDPNVTLTLMGQADSPKPTIQLFWNRKTNRMLVHAFQLTPAASRRAYQLWFIPKDGAPIPSITFNTEPSGHGLVQGVEVPAGMELAAAAITEEPEGGSPQPTTPVLLVASFAQTPS